MSISGDIPLLGEWFKSREKSKAAQSLKETQSKRKKEDHMEEILSLPEITDDFPSMLELTMADRDNVDKATDD